MFHTGILIIDNKSTIGPLFRIEGLKNVKLIPIDDKNSFVIRKKGSPFYLST